MKFDSRARYISAAFEYSTATETISPNNKEALEVGIAARCKHFEKWMRLILNFERCYKLFYRGQIDRKIKILKIKMKMKIKRPWQALVDSFFHDIIVSRFNYRIPANNRFLFVCGACAYIRAGFAILSLEFRSISRHRCECLVELVMILKIWRSKNRGFDLGTIAHLDSLFKIFKAWFRTVFECPVELVLILKIQSSKNRGFCFGSFMNCVILLRKIACLIWQ